MQRRLLISVVILILVMFIVLQGVVYFDFGKDNINFIIAEQSEQIKLLHGKNQELSAILDQIKARLPGELRSLQEQDKNHSTEHLNHPSEHPQSPKENKSKEHVEVEEKTKSQNQKENSVFQQTSDPSRIPLDQWNTKVNCVTFTDFTEICFYEHLCYNQKQLIFIDQTLKDSGVKPMSVPEESTRFDETYFEYSPWPPPSEVKNVPHGSHYRYHLRKTSNKTFMNHSKEFVNGTIWYGPYDGSPNNLYHICAQNMNIYEAKLYNESRPESGKFPSIDYVVIPRDFFGYGWQEQLVKTMVQDHTTFLLRQWLNNEKDFVIENRPSWYSDVTDQEHLLNIPIRASDLPSISEDHWLCSARAVVFGQKQRIFSGVYSAHRFKSELYDMLQLPKQIPRGKDQHKRISQKVVVDFRGVGISRNLLNIGEIEELIRYYGLEFVPQKAWPHMTPVEKQIEQLFDADVYIVVHGAGVTNAMFLPYRATLIEIYPYSYRPPMYDYLADAVGLHYIGLQSWIKGPLIGDACGGELYTSTFYNVCQNQSNLEQTGNYCGGYGKNSCVVAPIHELEMALLDAYDWIGVNLNPRVNKLFSSTREFRANDWHHPDNYLWTDNPWNHNVVEAKTLQQHLDELKQEKEQKEHQVQQHQEQDQEDQP